MGLHLTPAAKVPYYLNEFKWGYNIKSYGYISLKYLKWVISQVYLSRAITISSLCFQALYHTVGESNAIISHYIPMIFQLVINL